MNQLNKLSNPNKIELYTYLCMLEEELKNSFGLFDIKSTALNSFLGQERILLGSLCDSNEKKKGEYKYYLLCNLRKPDRYINAHNNDQAFLHLKHIRNAIAHANVKSVNKLNYSIEDYSENGNLSAIGKMRCDVFYRLIEELLKTKRRK